MRKNSLALMVGLCLVPACEKPPAPPAPTTAAAKETTSATPAATTASTGAELELVPKTSFGPIRLGASKADIEALGILKVHPQYSAMTVPFTVYYDGAGKAKRIQLSLQHAPADVRIGSLVIPRSATFADAKALLADCKDEPPAIGGTTTKCRGGAVNVSIGSGSPTEVWLEADVGSN